MDPLPVLYTPHKDRKGDRHVLALPGGWLVGFNDGEFGGGLWWFSDDGQAPQRVRPPKPAPATSDDLYIPENVLGFVTMGNQTLVLMGLNHLTGRAGYIFHAEQGHDGGWHLTPFGALDASPEAWLVEDVQLLVITESGFWTLAPDGHTEHTPLFGISQAGPADSLVRGGDGALYVGLRHYVLRMVETTHGLDQEWFAPSDCVALRMHERCDCDQSN
jgi:hypothetical protein